MCDSNVDFLHLFSDLPFGTASPRKESGRFKQLPVDEVNVYRSPVLHEGGGIFLSFFQRFFWGKQRDINGTSGNNMEIMTFKQETKVDEKKLTRVNGFKDTKRIFFLHIIFGPDVSGPTESGGCHFFRSG